MNNSKTALVTGANRGIGRAVALRLATEGFHVIAAARDANKALDLVSEIRAAGGSAEAIDLEMSDTDSINQAAKKLATKHTKLDVLVNNAGVFLGYNDSIMSAQQADIDQSIQVNAFGPLHLTQALAPLLRASNNARVVNVSSSVGSIGEIVDPNSMYGMTEGAPYRLSKVVLNGITGLLAKEFRADGIKVNSMCPGWTKTDMGGADAPNTPAQAALLALRLATLPKDGTHRRLF
jgi:NAD(P)-dependent dehydrogenase (short-subunit alcohol dehydrogenase family)